jgi:DNA repair protein RadC
MWASPRSTPDGNFVPRGIGVPVLLFSEENVIDTSTRSRAYLVRELLAPFPAGPAPLAPHAGDSEPAYHGSGAIDTALAHKLSVARELIMRDLQAKMRRGPVMNSPQTLRDWLRLYCAKLEHEVFLVLYLSAQNHLIEAVELFRGTLTQTSVYPRELVRGALERHAAAVVVAHNHPSGNTQPSRADEALTQTLKAALSLVDVRVLDHFIVAGDEALSLAERGLL